MSRKRVAKDKTEKANAGEENVEHLDHTPKDTLSFQTFDVYHCLGNVKIDFPELCALLDIKHVPSVSITPPVSITTANTGEAEDRAPSNDSQSQIDTAYKPCLQVELENENPLSAKSMKISGWLVDKQIARVLEKMLPSMSQLQSIRFWQARLTDPMVISLMSTISLCANLRVVAIEGNPLPKQSYHLLLSEDSVITHLSLRNNWIRDEGARLIGSALSTAKSANKNLLSLNLAFNSIGNAGATYIAQGLRLNRVLLFLSLSNNHIGDAGAAHLAAVLGKFALTHEEIVARRKLLMEKAQSAPAVQLPSVPSSTSLSISKGEDKRIPTKKEASKKDEKLAASKENPKAVKKSSEAKASQSKSGRSGVKESQLYVHEEPSNIAPYEQHTETLVELVNPLLEQSLQRDNGHLFLPGNMTLASLNLAGNKITEESLPLFLASLEMQGERRGLLRLCLQRNHFPPDCESYVKIKELMALRSPLTVKSPKPTEEDGQRA